MPFHPGSTSGNPHLAPGQFTVQIRSPWAYRCGTVPRPQGAGASCPPPAPPQGSLLLGPLRLSSPVPRQRYHSTASSRGVLTLGLSPKPVLPGRPPEGSSWFQTPHWLLPRPCNAHTRSLGDLNTLFLQLLIGLHTLYTFAHFIFTTGWHARDNYS